MKPQRFVLGMVIFILTTVIYPQNRIQHNNQDIFLSGMNLAWINFANDLTSFNESEFTRALDEISAQGGNALRWWLHVNGQSSPQFTGNMVSGISAEEIESMRKALDLAAEHGMGIVMCLWSFDMMRTSAGATITGRNRLMLTDDDYLQAYIDHALIPILDSVGNHPAVICWEVFNEPEGMSNEFGWSDIQHVPMEDIQKFVNRVAGTIHREVPGALVSNGCWSFLAGTDVDGNQNYYTDSELIDAGGDADGTLDFYMVHYYDWGGTAISPFHHPAAYWALDKPLVIGEFSANGPFTGITPIEAYNYLYDNGYAGGLSWTWTGHDGNGGVADAAPGMLDLYNRHGEDIIILYDSLDINYTPRLVLAIPDTALEKNSGEVGYVNLKKHFSDVENGSDLIYTISDQSNPATVLVSIESDSILSFEVFDTTGVSVIETMATDSGGKYRMAEFTVSVFDTASADRALFRRTTASSVENTMHRPVYAVDGDAETRWSSQYEDDQWFQIELEKDRPIQRIMLNWEAAFGFRYHIYTSNDGVIFENVFTEESGNGARDLIIISNPEPVRYVKMEGSLRGTQWGYSLWSFEMYGDIGDNSPPYLLDMEDTLFAFTGSTFQQFALDFFADSTGGDQLVYEIDYSANPGVANWLSFNESNSQDSAVLTGTPANENIGVNEIGLTASDRYGESITTSFSLKVVQGLGLDEYNPDAGLSLFPNPTSGLFSLRSTEMTHSDSKIELLDLRGRLLRTFILPGHTNCVSIDVSDFEKGIYLLRLTGENGYIVQRLIKE